MRIVNFGKQLVKIREEKRTIIERQLAKYIKHVYLEDGKIELSNIMIEKGIWPAIGKKTSSPVPKTVLAGLRQPISAHVQ